MRYTTKLVDASDEGTDEAEVNERDEDSGISRGLAPEECYNCPGGSKDRYYEEGTMCTIVSCAGEVEVGEKAYRM